MINDPLCAEAIAFYDLHHPSAQLIRHNENRTYKIEDAVNGKTNRYVLRIHDPVAGYSLGLIHGTDCVSRVKQVESELSILTRLRSLTSQPLQAVVPTKAGSLYGVLANGIPISMLEWVEGKPLSEIEMSAKHYQKIGTMTAELHRSLRQLPQNNIRPDYGHAMLSRCIAEIDNAVESGAFDRMQASEFKAAISEMDRRMTKLDQTETPGLVHADLSPGNMLLTPDEQIVPIDFSLCGYSHRAMDLGGLFGNFRNGCDRKLILDSYAASEAPVDPDAIEPYYALSVLLFIVCQYTRYQKEEWFKRALVRWCNEIFRPLAIGESLNLI